MLDIEEKVIDPNVVLPLSQDYKALRELGVEYLQKLSGTIWTDFNIHDPGITILELLCYAITDLGYRTNFDIADILTPEGKNSVVLKNSFFKPNEILECNPVTQNDYRRLFLDRMGINIKNVFLIPRKQVYQPEIYVRKDHKELSFEDTLTNPPISLKGLYNINLEINQKADFEFNVPTEIEKNKIKNLAKSIYLKHRNIGEDFECIGIAEHEYVGICADFELNKDANPVLVKTLIYKTINEYVSPTIPRYSIQELQKKGKRTEEIFQGIVPKYGFIDEEELVKFQPKTTLYSSDIINLLMDINGIKSIKKFHFNSYKLLADNENIDVQNPICQSEKYCLHLQNEEKIFRFRLDILDLKTDNNRINKFNFYFDDLLVPIKIEQGEIDYVDVVPESKPFNTVSTEMLIPKGQYRDLSKYYSIQNEFPKAYRLGQEGIEESASNLRKNQRLQLKAYLSFFEQIMADYLSQLNSVKEILSWGGNKIEDTYFSQALTKDEITDFDIIKNNNYTSIIGKSQYLNEVMKISEKENFDRCNRFLNHLLGRFNDNLVEFSISQFIKKTTGNTYSNSEIVRDKKDLLKNYPSISGNRFKGLNYNIGFKWNSYEVSGFEKRVAKKIGLNKSFLNKDILLASIIHPKFDLNNDLEPNLFLDNRTDSYDKTFGFHLIEHVLLRPHLGSSSDPSIDKEVLLDICEEPDNFNEDCYCRDPYSFKLTVVLPGWLPISMDMSFRAYIEKQFREECPAHISLKLCWLGAIEMFTFENAYAKFLKSHYDFSKNINCYYSEAKIDINHIKTQNDLVKTINGLNNVYPPSFLIDCDDLEIDPVNQVILKQPIVLGKSALFGHEVLKNGSPADIWVQGIPVDVNQLKKEKKYFENL